MNTKKRLSKALAAAGVASRRACEELIFAGKITVNGAVVYLPQTLVSWETDDIRIEGKQLSKEDKKVYYILNKPKGYICSNKRVGDKKIILDLFEGVQERVFSIGRLDRDTSGLLLVTNDGHFANRVIHPSSNIAKEYLVKTQQEISHQHLVDISKGTRVENIWIKPAKVTKVRGGTLKVIVHEGKKREVRLLVENAGLTILELKRIRIGSLILGPIPLGSYREMTEQEKEQIFQ